MSFKWHGQDVVLKSTDYTKVQTIELAQLNNIMVNLAQLSGMSLCCFTPIEDLNNDVRPMSPSTIST